MVFVKQICTVNFHSSVCLSTYMNKIFLSYAHDKNDSSSMAYPTFEVDTNVRRLRNGYGFYPLGQIIESKLRYPLMLTDNMVLTRQTCITASNYYIGSINNLAIPINKTSSYNMKIVYDILDG